MAEEPIWKGTSSQLKHFWLYLSCILLLPIPRAIWAWLEVRCRVYTVTSERLIIESGVINKVQDTLELYRVRDIQVTESFIQRIFNRQNIHLLTTDVTSQSTTLEYIPKAAGLPDQLRALVEACRTKKGVREIGIDLEPGVSPS
jgi:uncharacterized membrane protein YdbT with pleckstrin-like domain